jgi:hypothetical protein
MGNNPFSCAFPASDNHGGGGRAIAVPTGRGAAPLTFWKVKYPSLLDLYSGAQYKERHETRSYCGRSAQRLWGITPENKVLRGKQAPSGAFFIASVICVCETGIWEMRGQGHGWQ